MIRIQCHHVVMQQNLTSSDSHTGRKLVLAKWRGLDPAIDFCRAGSYNGLCMGGEQSAIAF
jgi:hypothetical protein